jgi:diaminobutyrate-2-oxoglutarate transaminase
VTDATERKGCGRTSAPGARVRSASVLDAPHTRVHPTIDDVFARRESEIRSYCRSFPAVFDRARNAEVWDVDGNRYLDFLAGAGALNYGHNHPRIKAAVLEYLLHDGIPHALDLHTRAKARFLETLERVVLTPRRLDMKVQFCGPTGTNAVEAALKLARKVTGRTEVFAFRGGYHGHSLGSLAVTANVEHRRAAGIPLGGATFVPFAADGDGEELRFLRNLLEDTHAGVDRPAAVIVEPVQAEGGVNVAPDAWMRALRRLCDEHGMLLIVDEIQTGVGRTGRFFAFEHAGVVPDLVTLSKSIGGNGAPMALLLMRPELDQWRPAEHTGTFRGNQAAMVAAAAGLEVFADERLDERATELGGDVVAHLAPLLAGASQLELRGRGLLWGLDLSRRDPTGSLAASVARACFDDGLIVERVGRNDTVLKLLPPLTIAREHLHEGLDILVRAVEAHG